MDHGYITASVWAETSQSIGEPRRMGEELIIGIGRYPATVSIRLDREAASRLREMLIAHLADWPESTVNRKCERCGKEFSSYASGDHTVCATCETAGAALQGTGG